MIWERLLVILILGLVGMGAFTAVKHLHARRINRRTTAVTLAGQPALLYFRSDGCAACPTQARYLAEVLADEGQANGRVVLHSINVDAEPEQASRYGVMTLPTTMLLDAAGQVRQINYGLTPPHKLRQQLASMEIQI